MQLRATKEKNYRVRVPHNSKRQLRIIKAILLSRDTQKYDLSDYLEMSPRSVRYWVQGKFKPNQKVINSIEYYFDTPINYLFHECNHYSIPIIEKAIKESPIKVYGLKHKKYKDIKFLYPIWAGLIIFYNLNPSFFYSNFKIPYRAINDSFYRGLPLNPKYQKMFSE